MLPKKHAPSLTLAAAVALTLMSVTACAQEKSGENFTIKAKAPAAAKVGEKVKLEIAFTPTNGYHMNKDAPSKVAVKGSPGVKLAKDTVKLDDASGDKEKAPVFTIEAEAAAPGKHTIDADLKMYICSADLCVTVKENVSAAIDVQLPKS